jgi:hypothetical protein
MAPPAPPGTTPLNRQWYLMLKLKVRLSLNGFMKSKDNRKNAIVVPLQGFKRWIPDPEQKLLLVNFGCFAYLFVHFVWPLTWIRNLEIFNGGAKLQLPEKLPLHFGDKLTNFMRKSWNLMQSTGFASFLFWAVQFAGNVLEAEWYEGVVKNSNFSPTDSAITWCYERSDALCPNVCQKLNGVKLSYRGIWHK